MRIVPLSSSMSTSAWTFGPCFFASAAWIPSYRIRAARSASCFEFVSSLIGTIFPVNQPSLAPYRFR